MSKCEGSLNMANGDNSSSSYVNYYILISDNLEAIPPCLLNTLSEHHKITTISIAKTYFPCTLETPSSNRIRAHTLETCPKEEKNLCTHPGPASPTCGFRARET